eukprot:gene11377-12401_t
MSIESDVVRGHDIRQSYEQSFPELSPSDEGKQRIFQIFAKQDFVKDIPQTELEGLFENFYWLIYQYVKQQFLQQTRNNSSSSRKPLFIGLSAPQGSGKTTLTELLEHFFASEGIRLTYMSLDDFYLTGREQDELSIKYPENSLLKYRGNAGTHDVDLLYNTLAQIKQSHDTTNIGEEQNILIPRYIKSLRNGLGDRAPLTEWIRIQERIDIVLFEGWMLGFKAKDHLTSSDTATAIREYQRLYPTSSTTLLHESIENINTKLKEYKKIHDLFDSWIVFKVPDINIVYDWRLQAEHVMIEKSRKGLSDEQVRDFVARFMPGYHTYLDQLYVEGPERRTDESIPILMVEIDRKRMPTQFSRISNPLSSKPLSKL